MPTYIKTVSFQAAARKFKADKDDPEINAALERLQAEGARVLDIKISLGGAFSLGLIATYLITYEAPSPISG